MTDLEIGYFGNMYLIQLTIINSGVTMYNILKFQMYFIQDNCLQNRKKCHEQINVIRF